jgi:hypothetical protein
MNLTNDEAAKVIEALKLFAAIPNTVGAQMQAEALAILQAAKDRPQPKPVAWMDEFGNCLSVTQLSLTDKKVAQHYTTPLYTHPPQPAVDKLIEAGNLLESATRQAYADNECPQEQINNSYALNAWTAAKSAAPVAPLVGEYAIELQPLPDLAAPVDTPKVSQDEYDRMSFVMRGGVTPIPAKVDVDAVISAVEQWHEDAGEDPESGLHAFDLLEISPFRAKAISDLRSRLTKLFNA